MCSFSYSYSTVDSLVHTRKIYQENICSLFLHFVKSSLPSATLSIESSQVKGSCHQLIFRDPSKCPPSHKNPINLRRFFLAPIFSGVLWLEKVHQGRARRELEVIYSIQEHEMKILKNLRILYLTISQIQVTSVWPHEKDGGGLDQLLFQLPRYPAPHTSTQTSWYWGQNSHI